MDPIRNRTAERARRGGRGVAPPGPPPRRRRRRFPMGSGRVPTEFRPPRTRPRQEPEFRDADVAPPGTRRNSRGTEWGLDRNRDPSGSSRMGTEWGLGPFTIEQTTEDVTAIHRLAASRLRGRRDTSPPATGPGNRAEIRARDRRDRHGREPDERSGRPRTRAPHEEARSERTGGRRSARDGGRTRPKRRRRTRQSARGALGRMAEGEPDRRPEGAVRAARREVSTGTN
jgi:hypothetical protein